MDEAKLVNNSIYILLNIIVHTPIKVHRLSKGKYSNIFKFYHLFVARNPHFSIGTWCLKTFAIFFSSLITSYYIHE